MYEQEIAAIKRAHRECCYYENIRMSINIRLGWAIRNAMGWRKTLPEKERKKIEATTMRIVGGKDVPAEFERMVSNTAMAREAFELAEKIKTKLLEDLAEQFDVWEGFGKGIRGFGSKSLAVIIAEAGDLSGYATDAKLWKRMGISPGQNRVPKNLSKDDRKQAWIDRGYNSIRRSRMFVVGEAIIKAQVRKVKDADGNDTGERAALGVYGELYLRRKLHTQKTHPEWWTDKDGKAKADPKTGRPISEHGNKDAHRYVEKRLLRDLWRAWREATEGMSEGTKIYVPPTEIRDAA